MDLFPTEMRYDYLWPSVVIRGQLLGMYESDVMYMVEALGQRQQADRLQLPGCCNLGIISKNVTK